MISVGDDGAQLHARCAVRSSCGDVERGLEALGRADQRHARCGSASNEPLADAGDAPAGGRSTAGGISRSGSTSLDERVVLGARSAARPRT